MKRLTSTLGYTAAALTIVAAMLTPFLFLDLFPKGVAATGVRIDPAYSGGDPFRTIDRGAYRITIHRPVTRRSPLGRTAPFVQLSFTPASALPAHVSEEIDVDGDGRPDLRAVFDVPKGSEDLRMDIVPLNGRFQAVKGARKESFSRLIARVNDSILVRAPLR